jgi:hypothetical protein
MQSGLIGRWLKMRQPFAPFSVSAILRHALFSAVFIINMFGFEFSVQTGHRRVNTGCVYRNRT